MTGYRDEVEALRQREQSLEQDLGEAGAALAQQGATLEQQRAALAAKDSELTRLRAELAARGMATSAAPATAGMPVHCPACGHENSSAFRFCAKCGGDLRGAPAATTVASSVGATARCPRCGRENPAHLRFCLGCGSELGGASPGLLSSAGALATPNAGRVAMVIAVAVMVMLAALGGAVFLLLR